MQIIAKATLRTFWGQDPKAEAPLLSWDAVASEAEWSGPADVKEVFCTTVDFVGNKYRLIMHFAYGCGPLRDHAGRPYRHHRRGDITGWTLHDTRGTAAVDLALAGCSVPELCSIAGHGPKAAETILDMHYLRRDRRLAASAVQKLEEHKGGNGTVNGPVNGCFGIRPQTCQAIGM